jgi:DNA repair protein RadC
MIHPEKKLSIKEWAEDDRPREKLLQKGINALSDAELLAILIGSGNKNETAVELSQRILASVGNNLNELAKHDVRYFTDNFYGIGEAKAITIIATLELGRRRKISEATMKTKITSSQDVADIFCPLLGDLNTEEFWILLLNRANVVLQKKCISKGSMSETVVDPKEVVREGILNSASAIILCHNHPSGNLKPSQQDMAITQKIKEGCKLFDLALHDHLIVTDKAYFSFGDEGNL